MTMDLTLLGEYDFQLDIEALLVSARDGHLSYNGDVTEIFVFARQLPLVSISLDGLQMPEIYAQGSHLASGMIIMELIASRGSYYRNCGRH